ncbi:MAG: hypothetical protein IT208_10705 [Chthonomonadales bacterium]|nr:hypothetical protein [Chthonomonadales bacterium]
MKTLAGLRRMWLAAVVAFALTIVVAPASLALTAANSGADGIGQVLPVAKGSSDGQETHG